MSLKQAPKKATHFPIWAETLIIAALLIMSVVEGMHGEMFFAAVFGLGGFCFGLGLLSRVMGGNGDA